MGYHDSLRENGSFNKIVTEDTITLCSYGKKTKEPWKIFLTVSKIIHFLFFYIFLFSAGRHRKAGPVPRVYPQLQAQRLQGKHLG